MDIHKETATYRVNKVFNLWSEALQRYVVVDFFVPPDFELHPASFPILVLNDGQDSETVKILHALRQLGSQKLIHLPIVIGIYAGNRKQEYGVASQADYKNRGSLAGTYTHFVMQELLPYAQKNYQINLNHSLNSIAGYSLGGLSAFDIAWHHAHVFKQVGVFSGAFWWRSEPVEVENPDEHRIMHQVIRNSAAKPDLRCWFQAGLLDETDDRNNNGIIDVIDDILDLSVELVYKGFRPFYDFTYHEMPDGTHDPPTWARAMPHFLRWAFGKK